MHCSISVLAVSFEFFTASNFSTHTIICLIHPWFGWFCFFFIECKLDGSFLLVYTLNFTFHLCSSTHHFKPNRQTLWCHTFNRAFWYIWNWKNLKRERFSRNKSGNLRHLVLFHAFRSNSFCRINNHVFNLKVRTDWISSNFYRAFRLAIMWKQNFHINHGASFET